MLECHQMLCLKSPPTFGLVEYANYWMALIHGQLDYRERKSDTNINTLEKKTL